MICVDIDELTPCLTDTATGDIVETEVLRVTRLSYLSHFNKRTGWHVNWKQLAQKGESVYALVIKGTTDVQGLIATHNDDASMAVYITWAVAAPQNNPLIANPKRYNGVGGHLFAIACGISEKSGYGGAVYGDAASDKLANHYHDSLGAVRMKIHGFPNRIFIDEDCGRKLLEDYNYEWSDDEL